MNEAKIISEIHASEIRLRDHVDAKIETLGGKLGALEVEQGRQGERLGRLEIDVTGAWKRIRAIGTGHKPDGSPKVWLSIVELITALPTIWKTLVIISTLVLGLSMMASRIFGKSQPPAAEHVQHIPRVSLGELTPLQPRGK